ncbi:MAG: 50S ribosomal protein L25/general stress protein Ctc [Deltaproteobacteria bacterium]|nr:50S ribosomal protein L25/general stress protein Ctc [Deltaproteobacteria bacterium]
METNILNAITRETSGKGPARRLRQKGLIPAVFYGPKAESIPITIQSSDFLKIIRDGEENKFIKLIIDNKGQKLEKLSMIKEFQIEPIDRKMLHADFYEISMDHKLTMDVPVHFKGQPVGVEDGGELMHLRREIRISCLPGDLPEFIEVDVSQLKIGDSIKIQDISFGEHITVMDHTDTAIASVAATRVTAEPAAEGEAAAEQPEVIGKKDAEKED